MKNGNQPITPILDLNENLSGLLGLTKREYFAAMAMQGLLTKISINDTPEEVCKLSVFFADELLKQLEQ
jgi:hypothetical protein